MITTEPNKICYIFDLDGTLTEPREAMNLKFAKEFSEWMDNRQCLLATGSDFLKAKQQIPKNILDKFQYLFCCMANEIRDKSGKIIHKSSFVLSDELDRDLAQILKKSKFHLRTGNHIEFRTGMINFSVVGRNASTHERQLYNTWDKKEGERSDIVEHINKNYPTLNASIGGSISIDIIEEGSDKGQIVHFLENAGARKVVFVGDRCTPGGNDWGVIRELKRSSLAFEWYQVENPQETLALLRTNKVFDGGK
tara:strand:- start:278 stop:1033 length:756 start_codon:yes stop_codon:yes gene_type:complete